MKKLILVLLLMGFYSCAYAGLGSAIIGGVIAGSMAESGAESAGAKVQAEIKKQQEENRIQQPIVGKKYIMIRMLVKDDGIDYVWIDKATGETHQVFVPRIVVAVPEHCEGWIWVETIYRPNSTPADIKVVLKDVFGP